MQRFKPAVNLTIQAKLCFKNDPHCWRDLIASTPWAHVNYFIPLIGKTFRHNFFISDRCRYLYLKPLLTDSDIGPIALCIPTSLYTGSCYMTVKYSQVWWPILRIFALHITHPKCTHTHTHTAVNTHTVNTHPEQWAAIYAAVPGEQLRCLAQEHLSRGIEGGESTGHSLPPPTIPAGPRFELATFGLRVWLSNH